MAQFLDQFCDPGVTVEPGVWTPEQETLEQYERLLHYLVSIKHVLVMKRRLGGDASPAMLSADKKIARMAFNRLLTCFQAWGGTLEDVENEYNDALNDSNPDTDESGEDILKHELIVKGAQMDWDELWTELSDYLKLRVRFMANNAVANDQRKVGNSMANRFVNEYNSLGDVLSPTDTAGRDTKFDALQNSQDVHDLTHGKRARA